MIILEKPYVSNFLLETIKKNEYQVLKSKLAKTLLGNYSGFVDEEAFCNSLVNSEITLYSNSENSYEWIYNNLSSASLFTNVKRFNNKSSFRKSLEKLYPSFFYKSISINEFDNLNLNELTFPFIIKPEAGFFSLAVNKVDSINEWHSVKEKIHQQIKESDGLFPMDVLDLNKFIIEEYIEGTEFAFDAYYNKDGEPVILNIFEHAFSSREDVSDRVYISDEKIMKENLEPFANFLEEIGDGEKLKNFPLHVEVRKDYSGKIIPIEINPLRFGGFCTTADFTYYSYGINSYEYLFNQNKPDWDDVFSKRKGKSYALIVLDNSTGLDGASIASFNYELLKTKFSSILELRKMDFKKYPLFGFLFVEFTPKTKNEIENILHSSLREFVILDK